MWVFGYGSLMWDGWENGFRCDQRVPADIEGYSRTFNKASVRNWGSKTNPGPTLNLAKIDGGNCRGVAFEFPDEDKSKVLTYLKAREGKGFRMERLAVRIEEVNDISAFVPIYAGNNIIEKPLDELADLVLTASGTSGSCTSYVKSVSEKLTSLGIDDPAVTDLWEIVRGRSAALGIDVP